jgi:transposase-like protein
MKKIHRIAPDVKEQILNRIKNDGASVTKASEEHGVSTGTIYTWLAKRAEGGPSISEYAKLKRENQSLKELIGQLTLERSQSQKKS